MAIGPFWVEIKQIPYLSLKIEGQGHDENRPKSNQVMYRSGSLILPKNEKKISKKLFRSYRTDKSLQLEAAAYEPVQKHKVTPGISGWLN